MLRVFEAFAGYGSQSRALSNLKIAHEVVGISEIDIDAIMAYYAIRDWKDEESMNMPSVMKRILSAKGIGVDEKTGKSLLDNMSLGKLKYLFIANETIKNYGDISKVSPTDLPDHDLFTYSFPCTDISIAGTRDGFVEGSGTRSSLLWECKKVIETKKPKYLLMENVVGLLSKTFQEGFNKWLSWLENQGYTNHYTRLSALDFGIPQSRERVIMVSILDGGTVPFSFQRGTDKSLNLSNILNHEKSKRYKLSKSEADALGDPHILGVDDGGFYIASNPTSREYNGFKEVSPTLCARDYKGPKVCAYTHNERLVIRRVSPREYWLLMGMTDEDFDRCKHIGLSDSAMYKLAGNSIVVQVLEGVFKDLLL